MTRTQAIYGRFEVFEEQLAHCYFVLHERFIADPPLAKFWADSAMEELEHFSILRFCHKTFAEAFRMLGRTERGRLGRSAS